MHRFTHCLSMILWLRTVLWGIAWLIVVLCTFFPSDVSALFTLYEEWEDVDMTYCSYYTRTKLQELTWFPETQDQQQEAWILQWDAIVLIEQLLKNNNAVLIKTVATLAQLLPNPEPYTLLDFYVYTPNKQNEINRFEYHLQGHRAMLLFLHETWWIYDPVKITFPYRQSFESYRADYITPERFPYVRSLSYRVADERRQDVDALFTVSQPDDAAETSLKQAFSRDWFSITYDDGWIPKSYRATQDLYIAWNETITIFVWSWTEIIADDGSPFSIDLLVFDEQWWLTLPWKTLLFSKPILFLDATQAAYALESFTNTVCSDAWVVIVPHTGTVSLGICRSGLWGR